VTHPGPTPATDHAPVRAAAAAAPYFDTFAADYDRFTALWNRLDPTFTTWLTDQLATPPRTHGSALDLGCGAGRYAAILARHSDHVLAVDTSERMLDIARRDRPAPNITYQQRDALTLTPERDGVFDVVFSTYSIHHFGPPEHVLPHLRSLISPGGTAILADITDPGDWNTPTFHTDRAFTDARIAYQLSGERHAATTVLDLLLHPTWLTMTASATPLTRDQFHAHYSHAFPGAVITEGLQPLLTAAVWHATPHPETTQPH
jgi:SAM-dependent methyltransferase